MAPPYTTDTVRKPSSPIAVFAGLTMIAGVGGMMTSWLFLASSSHLDVIAGAIGLIAGAVLVAAGLLSLAVLSRSPSLSNSAIQVAGCLMGLLPPVVAALAWPVLYFGAFIPGLTVVPLVLLCCLIWSWLLSESVGTHLSALCGLSSVRIVRWLVFLLQAVAILATWPLFVHLLNLLEAMGYRVGWS